MKEFEEADKEDEDEEEGLLGKCWGLLDKPFFVIRWATILPCTDEHPFTNASKWACYVWGIPGLALYWWLFKLPWITFVYYGIPAGLICSIFFFFTLRNFIPKDDDKAD